MGLLTKTMITMNLRNLSFLPLSIFMILAPQFAQSAFRTVLVHATSDADYRISGDQQRETYAFYPGHFEPGKSRTLMGKEHFDDISTQLENALLKQNYRRVDPDVENPDLILFVHWGQTTVLRNEGILWYEDDEGNPCRIETYEPDPGYEKINAELLGTEDRLYAKSGVGKIKRDLAKYATNQERYFFILSAYDFEAFSKKEQNLVWTTRFSIGSKWNDFNKALPKLCEVASHYFGKNLEDIRFESPKDLKTDVDMGEIEVLKYGGK